MAKAFKRKRFNDEVIALFLILLGVPVIASTNIDCNGKSFHCVNSTHFMICVDLGSGTSSTFDDFVIQCPPTTTCHRNNYFECEYFRTTTPIPVKVSEVSYKPIKTTSEPWDEIRVTVSPSPHVIERERENYYNTIDVTTEVIRTNELNTVNPMVALNQKTGITPNNKLENVYTTINPNQINITKTTVEDNTFMDTSSVVTVSGLEKSTQLPNQANQTKSDFTTVVNSEYVSYHTTISPSLEIKSDNNYNIGATDTVSLDKFNNTSKQSIAITASDNDADNNIDYISTTTLATDTTVFYNNYMMNKMNTQENLQEITTVPSIDQIGINTYETTTDIPKVFISANNPVKKDDQNTKQNGNIIFEVQYTTEAVLESTILQKKQNAYSANESITKYTEVVSTTAVNPINTFEQNIIELNFGNVFGKAKNTIKPVPESTLSQQLEETQKALSANEAVTKFTDEIFTTAAIPTEKYDQKVGEILGEMQHTIEAVSENTISQQLEGRQNILIANEAVTNFPEEITTTVANPIYKQEGNFDELNFGNQFGETTKVIPESTLSQQLEENHETFYVNGNITNLTAEVSATAANPTIKAGPDYMEPNNENIIHEVQYSVTESEPGTSLSHQFESNGAAFNTDNMFSLITTKANGQQSESTQTATENSQQFESTATVLQTTPQLDITTLTSHTKDKSLTVDRETTTQKNTFSYNLGLLQPEATPRTEPPTPVRNEGRNEIRKTEVNTEPYFGSQNENIPSTAILIDLATTSRTFTINTFEDMKYTESKNKIKTNHSIHTDTVAPDILRNYIQTTEDTVTDVTPISSPTTEKENLSYNRNITSNTGQTVIISINEVTYKMNNASDISKVIPGPELVVTTANTFSGTSDKSEATNQEFSRNLSESHNKDVVISYEDLPKIPKTYFLDGTDISTTVKDSSVLESSLSNKTELEKEIKGGQVVVIPVINDFSLQGIKDISTEKLLDTNLMNTSTYRPPMKPMATTKPTSDKAFVSNNAGLLSDYIQYPSLANFSSDLDKPVILNSIENQRRYDNINSTDASTRNVFSNSTLDINLIKAENKNLENNVNLLPMEDDSSIKITANTSKIIGKQNIEHTRVVINTAVPETTSNIFQFIYENKTLNNSEIDATFKSNDSAMTSQPKNSIADTLSVSDKSVTGMTSDNSSSKSKQNSDYYTTDINYVYTPTTKLPADSINVDTNDNSIVNISTGSFTVPVSVVSNTNINSNVTAVEFLKFIPDSKINKSKADNMEITLLDIPAKETAFFYPPEPNSQSSIINTTTVQAELLPDSIIKVSNRSEFENNVSKNQVNTSHTVTFEKGKILNDSNSTVSNENIQLATTENYFSINVNETSVLHSKPKNKIQTTIYTNKIVRNSDSAGGLNQKETEQNTKRNVVNIADTKNISSNDLITSNKPENTSWNLNDQSNTDVTFPENTTPTVLSSIHPASNPQNFAVTESTLQKVLPKKVVSTSNVSNILSRSNINHKNIRPDGIASIPILELLLNPSSTLTPTDRTSIDKILSQNTGLPTIPINSNMPTSENTYIEKTTTPSILILYGNVTFNSSKGLNEHVSNNKNIDSISIPTSTKQVDASTYDNYSQTETRNAYNVSTNKNKPILQFSCLNKTRGRYSDEVDCRKFYICFGKTQPIFGTCPNNTVFSETKKQCTNNMSQCIRRNEFQCTIAGRFSDYLLQNIYYVCIQNDSENFFRFKFQCQSGHYLNKDTVKCEYKLNKSDKPNPMEQDDVERIDKSSVEVKSIEERKSKLKINRKFKISEEDTKSKQKDDKKSEQRVDKKLKQNKDTKSRENEDKKSTQHIDRESEHKKVKKSKKDKSQKARSKEDKHNESKNKFECEEDGKFPDPEDCRRYYVCSRRRSSYRRRRKTCDSDELFDKNKRKCVDEESYECS